MNRNGFAVVVFFIIVLNISCSVSIPIDIQERSNLTECVVKIIENIPGRVLKLSMVAPTENWSIVTGILRKVQVPVVVNVEERPMEKGPDTQIYSDLVVVVGAPDVDILLETVLWNSETTFLMIWETGTDIEYNCQVFWQRRVVRVFALLRNSDEIYLYSFQPYLFQDCDAINVVQLDKWENDTFPKEGFAVFGDKRIRNGNGCPVRVSVVDVKPMIMFPENCNVSTDVHGTEAGYLENFARKYNFTAVHSPPKDGQSWGWVDPPRGVLGELYLGQSDFAVGGVGSNFGAQDYLDQTRPYNEDECITFFVPIGAGKDPCYWLKNILNEFSPTGWLLIFMCLSAAAIILRLSTCISLPVAFLTVFSSLIGQAIKFRSGSKHFMTFWITLSLVIAKFYEASLGSQITVPLKPPEIRNFEELRTSGLRLMGHRDMLDALVVNDDPALIDITKKLILTDFNIDIDGNKLKDDKNVAFIRLLTSFSYDALMKPDEVAHLRPMIPCVFFFPPVIAYPKNSPFAKGLDKVISQVFESGISKYWKTRYLYEIPESPLKFAPLQLKQSLGIFAILITGQSIASLVFVMEFIFPSIKHINPFPNGVIC